MKFNTIILLGALFLLTTLSYGQIKLPRLISDGAILQRDTDLKIWGWASPKEKITFTFKGKNYKTKADKKGYWGFNLPPQKASGPFKMTFKGKNKISVNDILFGDVWLCSGQSNMVHQLDIHDVIYADEIKTANYSEIRHFKIPNTTNVYGPQEQLEGGIWQKAIGEEVRPFSAVAYFFAKKIYEKYHVPIGLVNASVGGSRIEAWIPEEGFKAYPNVQKIIEENRDPDFLKTLDELNKKQPASTSQPSDNGLIGEKKWYDPTFVPKNWRRINIPGYWEDQGIRDLNGIVWYRREFTIPDAMVGKEAKVYLGRIVDADEFYINGEKVGNKTYQYPQRRYKVSANILKKGKNVFVVRVTNYGGKGGFVPDKPYYLFTEKDTIDLKGYWSYKVGQVFNPKKRNSISEKEDQPRIRRMNYRGEPSILYNAMVAPFTNYSFKGVLWYQGESNTGNPKEYAGYMHTLADSWRTVFKSPNIPFIYAQLTNFMDVSYLPTESNWAELRDAQLKSLSIANSAMVVNIDLGEWNDIHPDDKKSVGERMALAGLKLAYNEDLVYSGPIYKSHKVEGNKITISFNHIGSGLMSKDGESISEFAIAGDDKEFVWAQAKIEGDKLIVWSDEVLNPKYIRYAWANNPYNPNFYNKEGLPASPFEIKL
ncbi:sialate O-acetylesterase [Polaribacter reichenbachii]|uniref:9-O-acetylesterase n=1 Tax=Polaribacter reichenbachii TaxID=996801 RepID=A0A1B8TNR5_9FLAO|nr:sialate O-acetylesterase [Polaribacter reichenbachii]APZ46660.1 sialate O-acetylesterase [Polaribacter reichenbachii]AUC17303.1 sialate O-acetylesterase [Polaribacter reichenbachii]OBY61249.1 9-O-acetylesterase [Polaribacter reichenbachii]